MAASFQKAIALRTTTMWVEIPREGARGLRRSGPGDLRSEEEVNGHICGPTCGTSLKLLPSRLVTQTPDDLEQAFRVYFAEMERCASAGHHFALLHVIVALPDVCAALEDPGASVMQRYEAWCGRYHRQELLSPVEFYDLRCKLLHQGQAGPTPRRIRQPVK